ncbi:MAG: protein-methionine-sulfoxide reductase heme-binding subunit MsrQ [Rhodobacteraceae bacterium CG17_big_fil_post_rev_8_21_14_2_50_63_15]|nr:protein-methionine-sulfoxide reductase heme-binding subunit MsrQ [Roseovarius sp.]PIV78850.1 MAG: protein-methionine-sulfoxide reductase heme-binding subunit MsrQ [Rhodobacteraceae bacterium CG17_big_fil_post_rev_8_21_14_2_50_63_15]
MWAERINGLIRQVPVWAIWLFYGAPSVWLFYLGLTGGLGAEPIKALERELGKIALQLLIIGLSITPLRQYVGVNLIRFRRAFGLLAFFYVCLHLLVWLVLDVQAPARIWTEIVKRPYVMVGFTAFLLMIPLALTSNTWSVRRLGPSWRRLHRLTYVVAVLGAVHFLWLVKGFQIEPLIYLAVILGLIGLRWRPLGQSRRV